MTKTKSSIKDRYEKSFGEIPHGQRPYNGNIYRQKCGEEEPQWTKSMQARYFILKVDKKLYDARVATKEAVVNSGYKLLRKHRRSESQRWRDRLDKGYANYNPEEDRF